MKIKKSRLLQIVSEEVGRYTATNKSVVAEDVVEKVVKNLTLQDSQPHSIKETKFYDILKGQRPPPQADAGPYAPEDRPEDELAAAVDAGDQEEFNRVIDKLLSLEYTMEDIEEIISSLGEQP